VFEYGRFTIVIHPEERPIVWVGRALEDLRRFPADRRSREFEGRGG